MARILLCWELSGGLSHLARLAAIARPYLGAGHEVWPALRDLTHAAQVMPSGVRLLAAPYRPLASRTMDAARPPRTYADLISRLTFADAPALASFASAWRNLFTLIRPDIIVVDHSPTALLAARGLCASDGRMIRRALIGNGFGVPPDCSPLPSFLSDPTPRDPAGAVQREGELVGLCNAVLSQWTQPPIDRLACLWAEIDLTLLTTHPPLDPYAAHRPAGALYCDKIGQLPGGAAPEWPEAREPHAPCIFAYVKPFPALGELLRALCGRGCSTLIYAPELSAPERAAWSAPSDAPGAITFAGRPIDLAAAARQCDLAILNGTHAATCALLLAGKPTLQIPLNIEQGLTARAVRRMGAGLDGPAHDAAALLSRLGRLLQAFHPRNAPNAGASVELAPLMSFDEVSRMLLSLS